MATNNSVNSPLAGTTGTGFFVGSNSPTLVNPALGTPASGVLTNCTGLPIGGISATGTPSATTFLRGDGTWSSSVTDFTSQSVVTGSRSTATNYQNTSGKTMFVTVSMGNGGGGVGTTSGYTDSAATPTTKVCEMSNNANSVGGTSSFSFMVLNNNYYRVDSNSTPLVTWVEWR